MTPLRSKMIRELELRRRAPATIKLYVLAVRDLAKYFRRSPDRISMEEIRSFLHHLQVERKLSFSTCNQKVAALTFFYRNVLGREKFKLNVSTKRSRRLPEVFSRNEVSQLISAAQNMKHRVLLMTVYGAGLRVGEATRLKCTDIQSERMVIRVHQGKGGKDRYTILSERLLGELRAYWKHYRPGLWVFSDRTGTRPLPVGTAQKIYYHAKAQAGLKRGHGIHTLRHSFATHLLESGVDARIIQELLGHTNLGTTMRYLQVSQKQIGKVQSPFDLLPLAQDLDHLRE